MSESKYKMTLSLNVLNHLGLNLYSNTPAVLAEVIANAWDADATEVRVDFDMQKKKITISDNGHGMDIDDINNKFLYVGYEKRGNSSNFRTPTGRKPMGRKGIGKLSLFSIANKIRVSSIKKGSKKESFSMDAEKIKRAIQNEDPSSLQSYEPMPEAFNVKIAEHGTVIEITELNKIRLTKATVNGLRKRIARRFGYLEDFTIYINDQKVTFVDRDYFHKARFLFQYGDNDYAQHCNNLDVDDDTDKAMCFDRACRFNSDGQPNENGKHKISGWIAIARRSNDLDGSGDDDNLNKITVVVRGKVAQEDILQEYRLGGMITKYIYGEIYADFLDEDNKPDIATSSRQKIAEDDPRYGALKTFIEKELRHIWTATNKLKEKKGLEVALSSNPHIREWYEELKPRSLQKTAKKIFIDIDKANIDEEYKQNLYANGILSFETLKMNHALDILEKIDTSNLEIFLGYLSDIDNIEAAHYHQIVRGRLTIIRTLQNNVDENAKEKLLQEYVFDHLWLLDPAWERATEYKEMEERLQKVVAEVPQKDKIVRLDIRYRRIAAAHVIIELKRANVKLYKTDIESQLRKYIDALQHKLNQNADENKYPIESICIVGKLPRGWDNPAERKKDEESLKPHSIRVITYDELIHRANSAYSKFLSVDESVGELKELIEKVRNYKPT